MEEEKDPRTSRRVRDPWSHTQGSHKSTKLEAVQNLSEDLVWTCAGRALTASVLVSSNEPCPVDSPLIPLIPRALPCWCPPPPLALTSSLPPLLQRKPLLSPYSLSLSVCVCPLWAAKHFLFFPTWDFLCLLIGNVSPSRLKVTMDGEDLLWDLKNG